MEKVTSPLFEALAAIIGQSPPLPLEGVFSVLELDDNEMDILQNWCSTNANPAWSTGVGILDAAELIVDCTVNNANIAPK